VRGVDFDNHVSMDIYEGGLNRYLVFPASYFGFKYAQHLGSLLPAFVQITIFGAICIPALDLAADLPITLGGLAMCVASLALANLLYFLMSFPIQAVAFWADNVWSLLVALRFLTALLGGMMFPLALFPEWIQDANRYLPFRCLFAVPVEALLGRLSFQDWVWAMVVGLLWASVLGLLGAQVWRRGNLRYTGIGI
jgi:ABC-2 type transport system permease protein